jgi:exopolyphosphatase/guanosine-5'-triphosphate,3'-diphosphate pyrophosphatase
MSVAALDCGTNSTRLLVVDPRGEPLAQHTTITRLGQGVDATGRLAEEAIERTVSCLREYRAVMDHHGVERSRVVATSAARDADNRADFLAAAAAATGVTPELLTGAEEGRLAFAGATSALDPADGPFLVLDIGGGSTEFIVGSQAVEGVLSIDVGCVRVTEQYLHGDPPRPEELSACLSVLGLHLDDVMRELPAVTGVRQLVGVAGTVSAAARLDLGLAAYDRVALHHHLLTKEAVEDLFRSLATETRGERLENPGMEPGRVDVIVGGLCILVKTMRVLGLPSCLVSESDLLDGIVADLLAG